MSELGDDGWLDLQRYHVHLRQGRVFSLSGLAIDASLSYPDLVRSFLGQYAQRSSKSIISASVHSQFHRLPDLWPKARFVYLQRDPRDVAQSVVQMGWAGNTYFAADTWLKAERNLRLLKDKIEPGALLMLKYEDLVADVEHHLSDVCKFVGVPYSSDMLTYPENSTYSAADPRYSYQWKTSSLLRKCARRKPVSLKRWKQRDMSVQTIRHCGPVS